MLPPAGAGRAQEARKLGRSYEQVDGDSDERVGLAGAEEGAPSRRERRSFARDAALSVLHVALAPLTVLLGFCGLAADWSRRAAGA